MPALIVVFPDTHTNGIIVCSIVQYMCVTSWYVLAADEKPVLAANSGLTIACYLQNYPVIATCFATELLELAIYLSIDLPSPSTRLGHPNETIINEVIVIL